MSKDSSLNTETSTRFATLARVQRAQGKDGEVSVRLANNLGESQALQISSLIFQICPVWAVPPPLEHRHLKVQSVREAADRLLLRFEGIDDRGSARELQGRDLLVERSDVPRDLLAQFDELQSSHIDEDSFGLGFEIYSDNYGYLGKVGEVIVTGANLVWSIESDQYGEVLLPVIDDCILEVDEDAGSAQVTVMKGLIG